MKSIAGAAILLLLLSGCAAQEIAEVPGAQQSQESSTAEPSPSESVQAEEPVESEPAEPESEEASETETTAEPTAQATTQAQQSAEASPSPTATATATATAAPSPTPAPTVTPTPTPTPTQTAVAGYTMAEVRQNNTVSSCWVAVDGRVFNLTQWIAKHPGGPGAISSLCGTDGTTSFNARHGGQSSPTATLESYDIGPLR